MTMPKKASKSPPAGAAVLKALEAGTVTVLTGAWEAEVWRVDVWVIVEVMTVTGPEVGVTCEESISQYGEEKIIG